MTWYRLGCLNLHWPQLELSKYSKRNYDRTSFVLELISLSLGMKMNLTHKTRFWYILVVSFKIYDRTITPVTFIWDSFPLGVNLLFIPGLQTCLTSSLLPGGNDPKPPSVSWTKAVNSRKAATNNNAWIFIFQFLFFIITTSVRVSKLMAALSILPVYI